MAVINGTEGPDNLVGTEEEDIINGFGGNDTIDSVDRPSNIFAPSIAPRRDVVDAGDGDDSVTGGKLDQLNGGSGNDFLLLNFDFNGPVAGSAPSIRLTLDASGSGIASDRTSITGFESVFFNLTDNLDAIDLSASSVNAQITANGGNDRIITGSGNDFVFGGAGNDFVSTGAGNDFINTSIGNDTVFGGDGDDTFTVNAQTDGSDQVDLGAGNDTVSFERNDGSTGQVRITFTSAEVGNGLAVDSNSMTNQDGGLAVRVQAEGSNDRLTGRISRYDDEGITFVAGTQGTTFDVRDLVSGAARGDTFEGVVLGTSGNDQLSFFPPFREAQDFYYNAGVGRDTVTAGSGNDFLVGGRDNDILNGNDGNDTFIAGSGNDFVFGGAGDDTVIFNVAIEGSDRVDLGTGDDRVNVSGASQVRLTFTSAEVGNGNVLDSGTLTNQNGTLAVRLQAEADDAAGNGRLTGRISQFDDEGTTFVAATGTTFDVRDLVSGVERGNQFEVVTLGTATDDTLTAVQAGRSYYFNGGQGADTITGGTANDFLVGGGGNDTLNGGAGNDRFIGGAGDDQIFGDDGTDRAILSFAQANATYSFTNDSVTIVSAEGTDTYTGVEEFQFTDGVVTFGNLPGQQPVPMATADLLV